MAQLSMNSWLIVGLSNIIGYRLVMVTTTNVFLGSLEKKKLVIVGTAINFCITVSN